MTYRYYIGLQLPPELTARIVEVQRVLFDPLHMLPPLEPHITLLPPPAVERIAPEELTPKIKEVAAPCLPLALSLTEVMSFSDRAIVIGVASAQLHRARQALIQLVPEHPSLRAPFQPHVTLAQAARGKHLPPQLISTYKKQLASMLPCSIVAQDVTLFRWQQPRLYTAQPI